jgi:hypothetical protein
VTGEWWNQETIHTQGVRGDRFFVEHFGSAGAGIVNPGREGDDSVHRALGDSDKFVGEARC